MQVNPFFYIAVDMAVKSDAGFGIVGEGSCLGGEGINLFKCFQLISVYS